MEFATPGDHGPVIEKAHYSVIAELRCSTGRSIPDAQSVCTKLENAGRTIKPVASAAIICGGGGVGERTAPGIGALGDSSSVAFKNKAFAREKANANFLGSGLMPPPGFRYKCRTRQT